MDTPRSSTSVTQYDTPNGTPRGTPTSIGTSARKGARQGESPAFDVEINKLRSQLRSKEAEKNDLAVEVRTLQSQIATKDAAIEALESRSSVAEERALQAEGQLASSRREAIKRESERKRLQSELDAANADADRLNSLVLAGAGGEGGIASKEDMVRLHNQLASQRKEINRLKEECKGASNVIAAKDKALDQVEAEIATAKEAIASRKDDQNKIRDLRRQLTEAHAKLGGSERLGLIVETEASEAKAELTSRTAQFQKQQELIAKMQAEVTEAQNAVMEAERVAAEAKADAAAAVALADKARLAEASRMKEGGYISQIQHAEEVRLRENEVEALNERLQAAHSELQLAKLMRERVLNAVDITVDTMITSEDVSDDLKSVSGIVDELRSEIKELRAALAAKDADTAALESLKNAAVARALNEKLEGHNAKARLAQEIGEYNYTVEFNEPAPGPKEQAEVAAAAAAAKEAALATSVASVAAERDAANLAAAEAKLLATQAQEIASQASKEETQALAAKEEAEKAKDEALAARHLAEAATTAAALSLTEMQATLASKTHEVEGIHKALAALKEVDQRRQVEATTGASMLEERSAEIARLTALVAAAEMTKETMTTDLETAKKDVFTLEEKLKEVTAASNEATTAALTELEAAKTQLESTSVQYSKMKDKLKVAEAAAAAAALAVAGREEAEQAAALKISQLEEALAAAKAVESDTSLAEEAKQAQQDLEVQLKDKDVLVADLESKLKKLELNSEKQATLLTEKTAEVESASAALEALQTALEGAREEATIAKNAAAAVASTPPRATTGNDQDQEEEADTPNQLRTPSAIGTMAAASVVAASVGAVAAVNGADDTLASKDLLADGDHLHELVASKVEVAVLKQKVDELESELAAVSPLRTGQLTPGGAARLPGPGGGTVLADSSSDLEESDDEDDDEDGGMTRSPHFSRGDASTSLENAGMTSAALASVLDKLIEARQSGITSSSGGGGAGITGGEKDASDAAVYEEATRMLQAELARLGAQLADDSDAASKLKSEMGALQTAQLSAEATAQLLENQNALYMQISSLQIKLGEKESEYNRFEEALLGEIAALKAKLKAKKKKNPLSKVVSSAARGLNKGFEAAKTNVQDMMINSASGSAPVSAKKTGASPFASLSKRFGAAA
jgi:hypothetical protein